MTHPLFSRDCQYIRKDKYVNSEKYDFLVKITNKKYLYYLFIIYKINYRQKILVFSEKYSYYGGYYIKIFSTTAFTLLNIYVCCICFNEN